MRAGGGGKSKRALLSAWHPVVGSFSTFKKCGAAKDQSRRQGNGDGFADDVARVKGVVTYTQRSARSGRSSTWYYATVCLPGLHVVASMRRERAAAVRDHTILQQVKTQINSRTAGGTGFDVAVRQSFLGMDFLAEQLQDCPAENDASEIFGKVHRHTANTSQYPVLRFYAAISLARGFKGLIRTPCIHDLEVALDARRQLLKALGPVSMKLLLHTDCTDKLANLRRTFLSLHTSHGASVASLQRASRAFNSAERVALEQRDASALMHLRNLLKSKRRTGAQPPGRGADAEKKRKVPRRTGTLDALAPRANTMTSTTECVYTSRFTASASPSHSDDGSPRAKCGRLVGGEP